MTVIHKAVRPKQDYVDPTFCRIGRIDRSMNIWEEQALHDRSRISWRDVTCKRCLNRRHAANEKTAE